MRRGLFLGLVVCGACFDDVAAVGDDGVAATSTGTGSASEASTGGDTRGSGTTEDGGSDSVGSSSSASDDGDFCAGVTCGAHAHCAAGPDGPQCICDDGWYGDGTTCERLLEHGEVCPESSACESDLCVDFNPGSNLCTVSCDPREAGHCQMLGVGGLCVRPTSDITTAEGHVCFGDFDSGTEGDDAILTAGSSVVAELTGPNDLDIYNLIGETPGSYLFELTASFDVAIDFYGIGGQLIDDYSATFWVDFDPVSLENSGFYYGVVVVRPNGNPGGAYSIDFTAF